MSALLRVAEAAGPGRRATAGLGGPGGVARADLAGVGGGSGMRTRALRLPGGQLSITTRRPIA